MKAILLTRRSSFQIYCANQLYSREKLHSVVFEDGRSVPDEGVFVNARLGDALAELWRVFRNSPSNALARVLNKINHNRYYGNHAFHEERVLRSGYDDLICGLQYVNIGNVNAPEVAAYLLSEKPDLVYVFGTRLIDVKLVAQVPAQFINMHWGWSPDYRGEGIVSALATGGPSALGVTTHLLAAGIDNGDILYRDRLVNIDEDDNFYSIGLKLSQLGIGHFSACYEKVCALQTLSGKSQDLKRGKVYTSKFLRENPKLFADAWRNLKARHICGH